MNWIKYLVAAPLACIVLFNVWAYGNILSYRAIAPYRTSFMSMRMDELAAENPMWPWITAGCRIRKFP